MYTFCMDDSLGLGFLVPNFDDDATCPLYKAREEITRCDRKLLM